MQAFKQMISIALSIVFYLSGFFLMSCKQQQQELPPPPIPEVTTVTAQARQIALTTELPGRTSAYRIAQIRPQISGLLLKRLFAEGFDVEAGQVLYQIDAAPFEAALSNAKAALGRSEANLPAIRSRTGRYKELLADKAVSQQEYDDTVAELTQIEADIQYWKATLDTARINLGYTKITAPISGRIGKSNVTDGAIVTAYQSMPLATIQQMDPIYADVTQSTTDILRLKRSLADGRLKTNGTEQKKVKLILEDGTAYQPEGTLQFRDVSVDPTTGSVILRIVFPNPDGILLPGMFVRAVIQEGVNEQAILIPQQAVSRDLKGNPIALIVDAKETVQQRKLTLDRSIGDQWLVSSGVEQGDRIIIEGSQKVRPGTVVKAVPFMAGSQGNNGNSES